MRGLGPGAQYALDDDLGSGELHFGLRDIHPGDRSGIEPRLIDLERFASSVDRGLRDGEPVVQIAKLQGTQDCGNRMPPGGLMAQEYVDYVISWVANGAVKD